MTATAVEAELAVVYVISAMTIGTATPQPGLSGEGTPVAGVALHVEMRALQHKIGLPVVIELPLQPVHRVVAQGAVVREAVLVWIAVAVALDTFRGRIAENMGLVAGIALLVGVRAEQREPCQAVIEEDLASPGVLVMAVETGRALGAVVSVVVLVTGETVGLRFDLEDRLDVAGLAFDQFVCTVQRVVRVDIVVEVNCRTGLGRMAGLTGGPEMSVVVVVLKMAGHACDIQIIVEWVVTVAVGAGQLGVLPVQCKTCVARMIEFRVGPCSR